MYEKLQMRRELAEEMTSPVDVLVTPQGRTTFSGDGARTDDEGKKIHDHHGDGDDAR